MDGRAPYPGPDPRNDARLIRGAFHAYFARVVLSASWAAALALVSRDAAAQIVHRRFDPEDLDLETPGVVHADLEFGAVRGEDAGRWLAPDFDVDFGIAPNVELGIDGAWAIEGRPRTFTFDHPSPDNLWLSSKVELLDTKDAARHTAWAAGVQLGPRVAFAPGARGTGFQGLALLGRAIGRSHTVLNLGVLIEPGTEISRDRPAAVLSGADFTLDLDTTSTFSIAADVSAVAFWSANKSQLTSTAGPVWSVTPWLDLSVSALAGFLSGGDRYGAYVDVSPKIPLF